ncbi:MAG: hypothetical protein IPG04_40350 [Polyangiaceae bacterium]|nr:hypothetical protein [Polyangiaceae bacterium]
MALRRDDGRVSWARDRVEAERRPQQIVVDGVATKIWNVRTSTFQIEGAPACNYWLMPHEESNGELGLALSCAHAVGGLPSHMLRCVK